MHVTPQYPNREKTSWHGSWRNPERTPKALKHQWEQFYPRDWLADSGVTRLSPASRAVWFDFLCTMWVEGSDSVTGTTESLARLAHCEPKDVTLFLSECVTCNTAVTQVCNGIVTVTSRRRRRELSPLAKTAARVRKHRRRNADVTPTRNARVTVQKDKSIEG